MEYTFIFVDSRCAYVYLGLPKGALSGCPYSWLAQDSPGLCLWSINKGPYSLSWVSKFGIVYYMGILVTADNISHIDLNTEPIFAFLFEVYLMGQMFQGTHFGKHYEVVGDRRQEQTSFQTGQMNHLLRLQPRFLQSTHLTTSLWLKREKRIQVIDTDA